MKIIINSVQNSYYISIQSFVNRDPEYIKNFIENGNHLRIFSDIKKIINTNGKDDLSDFSINFEPDQKDSFIQISFFSKNKLDPRDIRRLEDLFDQEDIFNQVDKNFNDDFFLNELDNEIFTCFLNKEAEVAKRSMVLKRYMLKVNNDPSAENLIKMIYASILMLVVVSNKKINFSHLFSSISKRT